MASRQPTDFSSGEDERNPDSRVERAEDRVKMKIARPRTGTAEVAGDSCQDGPGAHQVEYDLSAKPRRGISSMSFPRCHILLAQRLS